MFTENYLFNDEKVSIIMPVFNGEQYLSGSIESVLSQSYSNFEFIIINDGSTDRSAEILESYSDPRIEIISRVNKGICDAYNTGFINSKCDYIFIMNQDDIASSERLKKQLRVIKGEELDVVGSFYNIINTKDEIIGKVKAPIENLDIARNLYYRITSLYNPTVCLRKSVFDNYGFFDPQYNSSADYEFYLRISGKVKMKNISEYLYNWRKHNNSTLHKNYATGDERAMSISLFYLEKRKNNFKKDEYQFIKGNIYYYYNHLIKALKVYLTSSTNFKMCKDKILKIIFLFWIIKLFRKLDLFDSKFILSLRNRLDEFSFK